MKTTVEQSRQYRLILGAILECLKDSKTEPQFSGNIPTNINTRRVVQILNNVLKPYDEEQNNQPEIVAFLNEKDDTKAGKMPGGPLLENLLKTEIDLELPKYKEVTLPLYYGNAQLSELFAHLLVEADLVE